MNKVYIALEEIYEKNSKKTINMLDKEDLLHLIQCYNDYIIYFYEEHDRYCEPVSIYEFYENEYQELKMCEENE